MEVNSHDYISSEYSRTSVYVSTSFSLPVRTCAFPVRTLSVIANIVYTSGTLIYTELAHEDDTFTLLTSL